MLRVNRLAKQSTWRAKSIISSQNLFENGASQLPSPLPCQSIAVRSFLDIYQLVNKEAIKRERARIKDEMSRGYFQDMYDLRKHGGKIAAANKVLIPAAVAVKFPGFEACYPDGRAVKLPIVFDGKVKADEIPKATLIFLSFRAYAQAMNDSWSNPFYDAFKHTKSLQLYQVNFIDSWLLSRRIIRRHLLRAMRKPPADDPNNALQRQVVYSFGDHYYFRKELRVLNLLTGYAFLLDKFGKIRWQGYGKATDEEISWLKSCASQLLEQK